MTASARRAPRAAIAALIILGLALAAVGVVYFTETAANLPAFFPGHQAGSAHHHIKHGLVGLGLAVLCFLGAWFASGRRAASRP